MKALMICIAVAVLASCTPQLECGYVADKEFVPEERWTTIETIEVGDISVPYPQEHYSPPAWYIIIGGYLDNKWVLNRVAVPEVEYNNYRDGMLYCREGSSIEKQ